MRHSAGTASVVAAWLAALAGCEAPSPIDSQAANAQAGEIRIANEFHDRLTQMSQSNQRLAMKRAIVDTGHRCGRVNNAGFQQDYQPERSSAASLKMWIGHCEPERRDFAVFLAPNGDVQVRNCADAGTLALPPCNPLPPPMDDAAPAANGSAGNAAATAAGP